jgi:hypothetical protein
MRVFQLLELPELLEADALYFILNGDYAESYLTDDNGVAKFIGNTSMIESLAAGGAATVAELTDATTYDFPTLNTPLADALAVKSAASHTHTNAEVNTSIAASPSETRTAAGLGVGDDVEFGKATLGNGTSVAPSFILGSGWNRGLYSPAGGRIVYAANDVSQFLLGPSEMTLRADMGMGWTSGNAYGVAVDTTINRLSAGVVGVPSITASGTVEAASYTRGGVAQQSVGTGDSVEFAGFESTANRNYLKNGAYLRFGGGAEIRGGGTASSNYYFRFGYSAGNDTEINSGGVNTTNLTASGTVKTGSKTVAAANALSGVAEGSLLWITNEAGGPCSAEYNGTAWVRVRDQIAISV